MFKCLILILNQFEKISNLSYKALNTFVNLHCTETSPFCQFVMGRNSNGLAECYKNLGTGEYCTQENLLSHRKLDIRFDINARSFLSP